MCKYAIPSVIELEDYGVPFSGVGAAGVGDKEHRRVAALGDCIRLGIRADAGRWLQALGYEGKSDLFFTTIIY